MANFDFPYHQVATDYPASGFSVQLGNSYTFSAPPPAPDQRKFMLTFPWLKYFSSTSGLDRVTDPQVNMALLEDFYNSVKMFATFTYPHPIYGNLSVRFAKPLKVPKGVAGGGGAILGLEIEFLEMPGLTDSSVDNMIAVQYQNF